MMNEHQAFQVAVLAALINMEHGGQPVVKSDYYVTELVEKFIRKKGNKWCVVSHKGKNLGCGPTKGWAKKRLALVHFFKYRGAH